MFTKQQFIDSIQLETDICKHLYGKMTDPTCLVYRPTEGQRSLLELLQYLTVCIRTPAKGLLDGDWSHLASDLEAAKTVAIDDFCHEMDRQAAWIKEQIGGIDESELRRRKTILPTKQEVLLGPALVNFPLKFVAAYRMQLFLYLKSAGYDELNTMNCWFGIDAPPPMD